MSDHLERKEQFIELKKLEIQRQIKEECQFKPRTNPKSKKILDKALQP